MSLQAKKIFFQALVKLFQGLILLKRGLFSLFALIGIPLLFIWRLTVRTLLAPLYRSYFWLAQRVRRTLRLSRNSLLTALANRYVLHGLIVIMTIVVSSNSLNASTLSGEEMVNNTLLSSISETGDEEIIVSASESVATSESFANTLAAVSASSIFDGTDDIGADLAQTGGSLVKPNSLETEIGDRPRNQVVYYEVEGGDTISTIARKFGVSTATIRWENKLPTDFIKPGQKLTILPQSGVSVQVQKGDTLEKIASKYKVAADDIVEYNKLASAEAIKAEMILLLPGAEVPELAPPPPPPSATRFALGSESITIDRNVPAPTKVTGSWTWPTTCRKINQYYKGRRHTGVDIDDCRKGVNATVYAARAGRVEVAGNGHGYGNYVIVNHGGGIKTLYGHFAKTYVRTGQQVDAGAALGGQGCTGRCTGTHLHFEIIINGAKVNPLSYL